MLNYICPGYCVLRIKLFVIATSVYIYFFYHSISVNIRMRGYIVTPIFESYSKKFRDIHVFIILRVKYICCCLNLCHFYFLSFKFKFIILVTQFQFF